MGWVWGGVEHKWDGGGCERRGGGGMEVVVNIENAMILFTVTFDLNATSL